MSCQWLLPSANFDAQIPVSYQLGGIADLPGMELQLGVPAAHRESADWK